MATKIVRLIGGLGNQMFQYAFAKAIQKKSKDTVLIDLSWFEECKKIECVTPREYELNMLNVEENFATEEQVKELFAKDKKQKKIPKLFRKLFISPIFLREGKKKNFQKRLFNKKGDTYFEGYFQTEKYFLSVREELLNEFTLKQPLNEENQEMLEKIKSCNSVSLHIRRGDYTKDYAAAHGLCSLDYYKKAMDYISEKVEEPHFFLFSDDIDWVVENFDMEYPFTVVNLNNEKSGAYDLELMKHCKHNIIANSSFSWWGAWLNENPNKIVFAPKKWFADKKIKNNDIIPKKWVKIG